MYLVLFIINTQILCLQLYISRHFVAMRGIWDIDCNVQWFYLHSLAGYCVLSILGKLPSSTCW